MFIILKKKSEKILKNGKLYPEIRNKMYEEEMKNGWLNSEKWLLEALAA